MDQPLLQPFLLDVLCDATIWLSLMVLPLLLVYYYSKRQHTRFAGARWLFILLLSFCGLVHGVDVLCYYLPIVSIVPYLKMAIATLSATTVFVVAKSIPKALAMRETMELEEQLQYNLAELSRANQRYQSLVKVMTDVVFSRDRDGNSLVAQEAWEHYTGQVEGDYEGLGWINAIHPDDQERAWEDWQRSMKDLKPHYIEKRVWNEQKGEYRYCCARAVPLFDENGEVSEWVGMLSDIHDRKITEDLLRQEAAQKNDFLAMLAHELRNPLSPISNCVTILMKDNVDRETQRYAKETISRQVFHLTRLIDDLLDVSRIIRGKVELKKSETSLSTILFRSIETSKPIIESLCHDFVLSLPPEEPRFMADEVRLSQVVSNLLSNAAKYTPAPGTIWLSGEIRDGKLLISVRDTGIGIPPESLGKIFEPFVQVNVSIDRSKGGLGIGLALVKSMVEMHGGTIEVLSEIGKGSEFKLILPLPEASTMNEIKEEEKVFKAAAKVLVVDDNIDAAKSLSMMLTIEGYESYYVFSGKTALAVVETYLPDVIILDIGLPEMDGFEVCRRLREKSCCARTKIIALTGYDTDDCRQKSQEAGMKFHLVKPVPMARLNEVLGEAMNQ